MHPKNQANTVFGVICCTAEVANVLGGCHDRFANYAKWDQALRAERLLNFLSIARDLAKRVLAVEVLAAGDKPISLFSKFFMSQFLCDPDERDRRRLSAS